jgi:hypothetical protein
LSQLREEGARQGTEPITGREPSNLTLNIAWLRFEQRGQGRSYHGDQALDGRHLRHLTEIAPGTLLSGVAINRAGECGRYIHEAWLIRNGEAESALFFGESGAARGKRDLGQKPERTKERWIVRCVLQACLCSFSGKGRH